MSVGSLFDYQPKNSLGLRLYPESFSAENSEACATAPDCPGTGDSAARGDRASTASPPGQLWTLRHAYAAYVLPHLNGQCAEEECLPLAMNTLSEHQSLLRHWERLTMDSPVEGITEETFRDFRAKLSKEPIGEKGKARTMRTVNKLCAYLKSILARLFDVKPKLLEAFKLPGDLRPPKKKSRRKSGKSEATEKLPDFEELFFFPPKQLSALYLATPACKSPKGFRKSHMYDGRLWRCALALGLNVGPRTWDLLNLRWENILWKDRRFRFGAVEFIAEKTGKEQVVPLNKVAREHLLHIRSLDLDPEWIFPGFHKGKAFYLAWERICVRAGVQSMSLADATRAGIANFKRVHFESLRKTCCTLHSDVGGLRVAAVILGHAAKGVTARHYVNPTSRVKRAIYRLKNPVEFTRGARELAKQRRQQSQST